MVHVSDLLLAASQGNIDEQKRCYGFCKSISGINSTVLLLNLIG